jgi:hypothetical protein
LNARTSSDISIKDDPDTDTGLATDDVSYQWNSDKLSRKAALQRLRSIVAAALMPSNRREAVIAQPSIAHAR